MQEFVVIRIPKEDYNLLYNSDLLKSAVVKEVLIVDDFFNGDITHAALKKASLQAYKDLKEYEFKKRHSI